MGIGQTFGKLILSKNSYFLATVFAGAFFGEILIDGGVNALWEWHNQGVSANWIPLNLI